MKKLFLTLGFIGAVAAAGMAQSGKIYLGADLLNIDYSTALQFKLADAASPLIGVSTQTGPNAANLKLKSSTTFAINLNGGYNLNEKWAIGAGIMFMNTSKTDTAGGAAVVETKTTGSTFAIMPYVRYMMNVKEKWNILVDAGISYSMGSTKAETSPDPTSSMTVETKTSKFGIFVRPGFSYNINDKWMIIGTMGTNFLSFYSNASEVTAFDAVAGANKTTSAPDFSTLDLNLNPFHGLNTNLGIYYTFGGK